MNQYPIGVGLAVALLMTFLAPNPLWWMIFALGVGANGVVVAANQWKMPVVGLTEETVRHAPMTTRTRRRWLADVVPTGFGKASLGDFFISAGFLGGYATRGQLVEGKLIALLGIAWWSSGWAKGFHLFDKWPAEARKDSRKNIPIVLFLMAMGNFINIRGCDMPELLAPVAAVGKGLESSSKVIAKLNAEPRGKWRDLGTIAPPSFEFMRRLRQETEKEQVNHRRRAVEIAMSEEQEQGAFQYTRTPTALSARRGPFCRVTCTAHHGGEYDVETVPEACRANWISPKTYYVPGWVAVSDTDEMTNAWPGPAQSGFGKYKLYWSDLQGAAKLIHHSGKMDSQ